MGIPAWTLTALLTLAGCHDVTVDSATHAPAEAAGDVAGSARHEVTVDGHPFAVHHKSAKNPGRVIVLVHGRTWSGVPDFDLQVEGEQRSLMDALVARGFASYALDLRGYGGTPRDDTGWLTPDRAAKDLIGVLRWVRQRHPDAGPPVLLGWSYGSMVSQLVAQRAPELVSDLVLFGYPRDPAQVYPTSPADPGPPPAKATTGEAAAEDFIAPGVMSPASVKAYVAACLEADPVRVDWTAIEQWNELDPARVTVPTLVIHGELDPYAPIAQQARLFMGLANPDRAWVIVAGGDHAAHIEDTMPRFVAALVGFVDRPKRP